MTTTPTSPSTPRASLPAIGGLLACVACCTIPFLAPTLIGLGVGTGLLTWLTTRSELLGLLALTLGGGLALWRWRVSRQRAVAGAACSVDGSCGCGPSASTPTP